MTDPIKHFLLTFDVDRQSADVESFGEDYDAALEAYSDAELRTGEDARIEVVLLGADSLETLKKTHSSYFMDASAEHPFAAHLRVASAPRI
ncbi:hypothetical protein AB0L40_15665 [Patulibacter sp. NPDC049589]|uniref:hypothetical protein n=1 Tax=Patulibacter sp. NPDC049589 TaxID=3154731 RepID=UPI00341B06C1